MHHKQFSYFFLILILVICGCSSADKTPVNPQADLPDSIAQLPSAEINPENSNLLGMWTLDYDPDTGISQVVEDRIAGAHYNVTSLIPAPGIMINGYDPVGQILDVDLTVNNPFAMNAYDLRLIIYTDAVGHFLDNRDGMTGLYDKPGGNIVNPFLAYAESIPNRLFAGPIQYTENARIYCPGGNFSIQFAIEASFPSNCPEPYSIINFANDDLYETAGSNATMSVDILDWQDDVGTVYLYCPFITGVSLVPLAHDSGDTWTGTIVNANGISQGFYTGYIVAYSGGIAAYEIVVISISVEPTEPGWALGWGSIDGDNASKSFVTDDALYVIGYFYKTVDFDPGPGVYNITALGGYDPYLSKFSLDGTWQWTIRWGSSSYEGATGFWVTPTNDIFITGQFYDTCDFDPGPGNYNVTALGLNDAYLLKLDSTGGFQWVKTWGGTDYDIPRTIYVTGDYIYVGGYFVSIADFDPGPGVVNRISNGMDDVFLSKFDMNGNFLGVATFGGIGFDGCYAVQSDSSENVMITGIFMDSVDFDPGSGTDTYTSNGSYDVFVCWYDEDFVYQKVAAFGGTDSDYAYAIALDSENNSYLGGFFYSTVDFDPGSGEDFRTSAGEHDCFVSKFDSSGNYMGALTWGGVGSDKVNDVNIDNAGNIYTIGYFNDLCDFAPGPGEIIRTPNGGYDIFMLKMNASGNPYWVYTAGSSGHEQASEIQIDKSGNSYGCGNFSETMDFEPGPGVTNLVSHGQTDSFIVKLNPNGEW